MRKTKVQRATIYLMVGLTCAVFNIIVFHQLLGLGTGAFLANVSAFGAGSQLSFILHDRKTFVDRNPDGTGWIQRWWLFMTGNATSFALNSALAAVFLLLMTDTKAHFVALLVSGLFSAFWNNFVSHRDHSLPWLLLRRPSLSTLRPVTDVEH